MADSQKYTSPVPTDYQEVEYIQSSGNGEYIDIDYTPTINTKFELDFAFVSSTYSQSDSIPVMGERSGTAASNTNKFALWVHKTNGRETLNFGSYDSGFQTGTNASLRNVTSNNKAKLYYNGTFISGDDSATFTNGNLSIYLFALNDNGVLLNRNNVMKVYNMKLYESETLVRDLIPCYRKTDNETGLYDTVNGVFYTNQGTGSFTVGANVSSWQHSLRKLGTATETIQSGDTIYADGTVATVNLKGNEQHTGTPSPQNPVMPNGTGERTENLFDGTLLVGFYLDINTMYTDNPNYRSFRIQGLPAGQYTVSWNIPVRLVRVYYDGVMYENAGENLTSYTVTSSDGDIAFSFRNETSGAPWSDSNTVMLNSGSTAKPYEPYGYKIPISSGQQTTNIYLGSTQTIRQIKKMVFDGSDDEPWYKSGSYSGSFYCSRAISGIINATTTALCNRAVFTPTINATDYTQGKFGFDGNYATGEKSLNFYYDYGTATLSDFKTWLSNNPITVWYVLATPTTGIVNEPLMKIGTYADTLSNAASIPTTEGANSITVDTTVQPSEFTATWTGWHDSSVKEWDGSQWE